MKFPSLNRFKSPEKSFPTLEELDKNITKFRAKIDENIKESKGDDYTLKSTTKDSFLILPAPFDSIASMVYDDSSGSARERIEYVLSFFKNLQSIDATQYNGILARIEGTISIKEPQYWNSQDNMKKIQDIIPSSIKKNSITAIQTESSQMQERQESVQTQSITTTPSPPQDENAKFEENKAYIAKILTGTGLPLVLRSEQNTTLQDEVKQEISSLLEENNKLKENLLQTNNLAIEEDEYLLRIANFYYLIGNSQKAIETYEYILKRNPTKMAILNNKGVVLDSIGEYNSALECFNKALERVPENVHVLSNKGISLYKSKMYQQALECFDAALKIDTNYINALTFKGHSLYRLGKNSEALDLYNRIIRLDHGNAEALYNKACLCSIKGDEYGAITSLERAIRLDSSWKEAASQDKDLGRLKNNSRFKGIVNYVSN
ncbi:MAG: tetratricopeptide repeat protein [Nitrosotalea sp.]